MYPIEKVWKPGDYYQPEPTPEIPYPVRHVMSVGPGFLSDNITPDMLSRLFTPDPTTDQKNLGHTSRITKDGSTSLPSDAKPGTDAGGSSAPSLDKVPDFQQMANLVKAMR